jgi:hypothetical protein
MKYTTEQLELIAMMFKIQFADKTVGDFFPNHWNELEKKINIGEMETGVSLLSHDINFNHFGICIFWFSANDQCMCTFADSVRIPIIDIVKMLSFKDKV